jgi:hypothetical protein
MDACPLELRDLSSVMLPEIGTGHCHVLTQDMVTNSPNGLNRWL